MAFFLSLTNKAGGEIVVNMDLVRRMQQGSNSTTISFAADDVINVAESQNVIIAMLDRQRKAGIAGY